MYTDYDIYQLFFKCLTVGVVVGVTIPFLGKLWAITKTSFNKGRGKIKIHY